MVSVGLDLGQAADFTAIAVIDVGEPPGGIKLLSMGMEAKPIYRVRMLERPQLGTPYPVIVDRVTKLMADLKAKQLEPTLVIDATGVGRPVVDMFDLHGVYSRAVTITGGAQVSEDGRNLRVPKADLVGACQKLLQTKRLHIPASIALGPTFAKELIAFRVKTSAAGHDSFDAKSGTHDDLVLAVCLAVWSASRDCNDSWSIDPMDASLTHAQRSLLLGRRADERARRRKLQAARDPDTVMEPLD